MEPFCADKQTPGLNPHQLKKPALASQVVVLGQLYQMESRKRLIEPDALLVIAIILTALAMIYYLPG